ncbi:tetratricopeptide repeat protein [Kangiella sp. HZ709]|uniref:tetratricopeptide repeat protein n=1 Tax=Kangiella sp. HZ709 TaxID=2666328 RepID=UPI0012AFE54C|nr:tetratricopeptide repeat protein [Kangiella sp. HZ709]MRX27745.1 tetratricopeptide repeat protein [Kangiella sp. HZ709]
MYANKNLNSLVILLILSAITMQVNAQNQTDGALFAQCQLAYNQEPINAAKEACQIAKQKAIASNELEQNLAITRLLIKINIKLGNHDPIETLFTDAKSLVTSEIERHEILRDHGAYYYHQGDYNQAEPHFQLGLEKAQELNDSKRVAKSLNDLGLIRLRKLEYKEALTYLEQSLDIKESLQLEHSSAVTVRNIALVYYRLKDNQAALKFYLDALQRYQKALSEDPSNKTLPDRIIHINTDLAALYARLGDNINSERTLANVYSSIHAMSDNNSKRSRYIDLAEGLIEAADYSLAKQFLDKATELLSASDNNHSRLYYLLGKSEFELNNLETALSFTTLSVQMAEQYSDNLILLKVYKLYSDIEEKLGNTSKALINFKKHFHIQQASHEEKYNNDLRQIKFKLETQLNEKRILERDNALLLSTTNNQRLTLILYLILGFILVLSLFFYHRFKLNRQKRLQLKTELQSHKARLVELEKPLLNFKHLFKDNEERILICNDAGFIVYSNLSSISDSDPITDLNLSQFSKDLNYQFEKCIESGESLISRVAQDTNIDSLEFIKITPLFNSEYYAFEFLSDDSRPFDSSRRIANANRFAQSINSLSIDINDIGLLRPIIVDAMKLCVDSWIRVTQTNKVEFAEQSKIWKVNIDEGRLRTRSLDKYLSIKALPKQPRLKNVIKTCYFLLSNKELTSIERESIELYLNKILAFDKS